MYLMLSTPRHVKRFWSANDQTNYRTAIRVVYDDNTTGIINIDGESDYGASGDRYYNISIGGQRDPNTNQIYYVDMLFFKKPQKATSKHGQKIIVDEQCKPLHLVGEFILLQSALIKFDF